MARTHCIVLCMLVFIAVLQLASCKHLDAVYVGTIIDDLDNGSEEINIDENYFEEFDPSSVFSNHRIMKRSLASTEEKRPTGTDDSGYGRDTLTSEESQIGAAASEILQEDETLPESLHFRHQCMNGGRPLSHSSPQLSGDETVCDCSGTSYEGRRCQYAKYHQSCSEYRRHGYTEAGTYIVDLDGSGPLNPVNVSCRFETDRTFTDVRHNIPQDYTINKYGVPHQRLTISYGELSHDHLIRLVNSHECDQTIQFKCQNAKLELASNNTWFSSPQTNMSTYFGAANAGVCPCKESNSCSSSDVNCNCDVEDGIDGEGRSRMDSATIRNPSLLPVTAAVFSGDNRDAGSWLQLSLGDLSCHEGAETQATTVSLVDSTSFLKVARQGAESLSFAFKTIQSQATVLSAAASDGDLPEYQLTLIDDNALEFQYSTSSQHHQAVFHTSYLLNSGQWQHVVIEFTKDQVMVALNGHKKFLNIPEQRNKRDISPFHYHGKSNNTTFDEELEEENEFDDIYFGGLPSAFQDIVSLRHQYMGMIGCISDIRINNEAIPVSLNASSHLIQKGCSLSCEAKPCENGATCLEQYAAGHTCVCDSRYMGMNCEIDLSTASFTFPNNESEFSVDYRSVDAASNSSNPIVNDVKFNFKTREDKAQLLFAYDNVQNILMVYLSKSNAMSIIWNAKYQLKLMVIETADIDMNNGQPVQFALHRSNYSTSVSLTVDGRNFSKTEMTGPSLITKDGYRQYPYGNSKPHDDLPTYQQPKTLPQDYLAVHLGRASDAGVTTTVPGLIGCFSGFMVGGKLVNLQEESQWKRSGGVVAGCQSSCAASGACRNGGKCLNVFDSVHSHPPCDCDGTAYGGDLCNEEVSYVFNGDEYLAFAPIDNPVLRTSFSVEFAFAANSSSVANEDSGATELMLALRDPVQDKMFGVGVMNSSHLFVWMSGPSLTGRIEEAVVDQWTLRALLTNGDRHTVKITYNSGQLFLEFNQRPINVALKHQTQSQIFNIPESNSSTHPTFSSSTFIGGAPEKLQIIFKNNRGYKGCISNVVITSSKNTVTKPLHKYQQGNYTTIDVDEWETSDSSSDLLDRVYVQGSPDEGSCSVPGAPTLLGVGRFDLEEVLRVPQPLPGPSMEEYGDGPVEPASTGADEDSNTLMGAGIAIGIVCLLLIVIVLIGVLIWRRRQRIGQPNESGVGYLAKTSYRKSELSPEAISSPTTLLTSTYPENTEGNENRFDVPVTAVNSTEETEHTTPSEPVTATTPLLSVMDSPYEDIEFQEGCAIRQPLIRTRTPPTNLDEVRLSQLDGRSVIRNCTEPPRGMQIACNKLRQENIRAGSEIIEIVPCIEDDDQHSSTVFVNMSYEALDNYRKDLAEITSGNRTLRSEENEIEANTTSEGSDASPSASEADDSAFEGEETTTRSNETGTYYPNGVHNELYDRYTGPVIETSSNEEEDSDNGINTLQCLMSTYEIDSRDLSIIEEASESEKRSTYAESMLMMDDDEEGETDTLKNYLPEAEQYPGRYQVYLDRENPHPNEINSTDDLLPNSSDLQPSFDLQLLSSNESTDEPLEFLPLGDAKATSSESEDSDTFDSRPQAEPRVQVRQAARISKTQSLIPLPKAKIVSNEALHRLSSLDKSKYEVVDAAKYMLTRKSSIAPAIPPKTKHNN